MTLVAHIWNRMAHLLRMAPFVGWILLVPATAPAQGIDDVETKEAKVKSAFLLNFARYVEWPENAFASSNSPVVIAASLP